jgi:peptidoglycan/LPS O-acetylase OafA/YrhL
LFSVTQPSGARDRALGEFTYVMYLLHWPVIVLHSHYFAGLSPLTRIPSLLVAWLAIGALSLVVFRYFDQPIERVRKRWVSSRRAA